MPCPLWVVRDKANTALPDRATLGVVPDLSDERKFVHAVVLKAVLVIDEVPSGPYYLRRDE
jgi:hypothetical protein